MGARLSTLIVASSMLFASEEVVLAAVTALVISRVYHASAVQQRSHWRWLFL